MDKPHLIWTEENRRQIIDCKIFSVWESFCKRPDAQKQQAQLEQLEQREQLGQSELQSKDAVSRAFTIIEAADWANVIPVVDTPEGKKFLMVWQWRHGSKCLSLEFPGGVFEKGENPEEAASRELFEETGLKPAKIKKLGEFNPNPAIMSNTMHFFLAEDLAGEGRQKLDEDEFVETELVSIEEVIRGMGKPPFVHALMGTALMLYLQQK